MIYLALDVGTFETGFTFYDSEKSAPCISHGKLKNNDIFTLFEFCEEVVIEDMVTWSRAMGASTRTTLMWMGRFIESASVRGKKWHLLPRPEVKSILGLKRNCKDGEIDRFIQQIYVPGYDRHKNPGILKGFKADAWAALELITAYCVRNNLLK